MRGPLFVVALLCVATLATVGAQSPPSHHQDGSNGLEFDQPVGLQMTSVINLSGHAHFPLRNASWSIVNISSPTPTTLFSGPYLTAVQPVADDEYQWELFVDVPDLDCTCYVEIRLEGDDDVQQWRHLVFVGQAHHRPVFADEQALTGQSMEELALVEEPDLVLLESSLTLPYTVVLPPTSANIAQVTAELCEAPNGVCREVLRVASIPFVQNGSEVLMTIDPTSLGMSQGVWRMQFTATDNLLRETGLLRSAFLFDNEAPQVELVLDPIVQEREPINIYASVEDGYLGESTSFTWTIISENGLRRGPSVDEQISVDHLRLNVSEQGTYTIEVTVRDRAGYMTQEVSSFTAINQRPTALISVDGLVLSNDVRLTLADGEDWIISGNNSLDNEPVDYLWVINDDRSWRGISIITPEQFDRTGVHTVELIVFDDDGATHATKIEVEILSLESEENSSMLGWIFPALLVLLVLVFVAWRTRSSSNLELPKWKASVAQDPAAELTNYVQADATIEEDEARG